MTSLSNTAKMPGKSWGLSADDCGVGSELAKVPGTTCSICYGRGGRYRYPTVRAAQAARLQEWLELGPWEWARRMVVRIEDQCSEPWFRWLDDGDLPPCAEEAAAGEPRGAMFLRATNLIAFELPAFRFWLPSHEAPALLWWRARVEAGEIEQAPNLLVRESAVWLGAPAAARPGWPSSSVGAGPVVSRGPRGSVVRGPRSDLPASSEVLEPFSVELNDAGRRLAQLGPIEVACDAGARGDRCGPCRACWSPAVDRVDYRPRRPAGLALSPAAARQLQIVQAAA